MIKTFLIIFLFFSTNAFATRLQVTGGGSSGSSGGSGNVGIGTSGWAAYYGANGSTVNATPNIKISGNDVNITTGNLGIGTTLTTTSALTVMNGNVGIGTWIPSSPLQVIAAGGATTTPNTGLIVDYESPTTTTTGGGTAIELRGKSSGGNVANYSQARIRSVGYSGNNAHGLAFDYKPDAGTALTEALRITNTGVVSVTSSSLISPTTNAASYGELSAQSDAAAATVYYRQYGTSASGTTFGLSLASLGLLFSSGSSALAIGTINSSTAPLVLGTNNIDRLHIDGNGNVGIGTTLTTTAGLSIMNGSVGIGTWVPNDNLDVIGNMRVGVNRTTSGQYRLITSGGQNYIESGLTNSTSSAAPLNFTDMNAANIFLTIAANGNVGIGTVGPVTPFEIKKSGGFGTLFDGSGVRIDGVEIGQYRNAAYTNNIGVFNGDLVLQNGASGYTGNVGIGTAIPASALQINSPTISATADSYGALSLVNSSNTNYRLIMGYDTASGTNGAGWIQAIRSGTINTPLLLDPNGGNVGISTTSVQFPLNLASSGATSIGLQNTSGAGKLWHFGVGTTTNGFPFTITETGVADRLIIFPGGNVGLGTISPVAKLDIAGTASKLRMQSPDGTFWSCQPANTTGVLTCT